MKRDNTPWRPVTAAAVGWSDAGDPLSVAFGDVYYSRDNGLEESRYVFLQGNDLPARWQASPAARFCIAETGFGTGLNFLLTWQAWRGAAATAPDLHYLSVEKHPLAREDLARALSAWPELAPLANQLLASYPGLVPGQHRLIFEAGRLTLDLWWEDVAEALPDLASRGLAMVDAWYLDGFAPARNAAMWQPQVLGAVARLSHPGGSFSTFTAAGEVRRQLVSAGFTVARVPGYGRKRECLRGRLADPTPPLPQPTPMPWDIPATNAAAPGRAIVLGAGLAGCTVAAALARRGVEVILLERGSLAGAASGNEQGILYTRLSRKHSALADFSLQSFCFSSEFYRNLFATGALAEGIDGALCGSFHQSADTEEMRVLDAALAPVPELARVLEAAQAAALLGIDQPAAGYWFPRSGWLHPAAVCRSLASHPRIQLLECCGEIRLSATAAGWRASDGAGRTWEAPCAVIAAGTSSARMEMLGWLPLQSIRGQTTRLPASAASGALRAALCHEGYIAPARAGAHCIGATFGPHDSDPALRAADHASNIASLARAVPAWQESLEQHDSATLGGKVGFRCASPDYLPLVGPVPDREAFLRDFAGLRSNARQAIPQRGEYLNGLFLSTAHGSRGLSSTPLAAELLASQICAEPPPLGRELCRALAPARFIIRDLSRNRI
ncbi:MAG: bifunctional tRNA (5-methylaminomethyl-2-thiouridine)(34)-methyltransferase MnmD/FAD-dependent 5-carboxymethylaminomethyl-2-thiouridine(34) oxidoreductase MnmC [Gammaproteobacteria bacterium]|nr:bifunctional tRNA (5-methylaminomethyl-2-thiouridine)(34)-methyltransferase MnmD/FAD-dependent 5-carboxymethylaminomethyl-2-thiouridine(34) oxidoreductase MnmC [Gammaproteobacteria bacterium]